MRNDYIIHGTVQAVADRYEAGTIATAYTAAGTSLVLDDASAFDPDGGTLVIYDEDTADETLAYSAVDFDTDTLTIAAGSQNHAVGVEVRPQPESFDRIAFVQTDDPELPPLACRVPHSLQALLPTGQRATQAGDDEADYITEEEVLVRLDGRSWVVHDVLRQSATIPASVIDTTEALPSDGAAPASSPSVVLTPGLLVLHARWDGVVNADPVTYEVHLSTSSGFTPSASTLVAETGATAMTIKADADGNALVADTWYYVQVIAKDEDGSASAGTEASAQVSLVDGGDIVAGSITADRFSAVLTLSSTIQTASSGRRVEMDEEGLRLLDSSEATVVDLPTNTSEPASFTGAVTASELTVESNSTFQNTGTFDIGSTFLLASSQADPTVSPTVSAGLASFAFGDAANVHGLWHDGTNWNAVKGSYDNAQALVKISNAGALVSETALTGHTGAVYITSCVKVGSYWYGLSLSGGGVYWTVWNDSAGVPGTMASRTAWTEWNGYYTGVATTDGTSLYVAQSNRTPTGGNFKTWLATYTAPGTGAAPTISGSATTTDTANASSDVLSVYRGTSDMGATTYWVVKSWNDEYARVYSTAGVEQTSLKWKLDGSAYTEAAIGYGNSEWIQTVAGEARAKRYTAIDYSESADSRTYYWAYAWRDSVGTTHESGLSPRTSVVFKKRRRFVVSWPTIPTGGADDPDQAAVYAAIASDPGAVQTAAGWYRQGRETGTSQTYSTWSTTTTASVTAFSGGTPATLQTQSAGMALKGDGTFVMPTFTSTARNAISSPATGRMLFDTTVGAFYVYNGSVWMPFGGFLGAQVPKNSDQNISNGINVNEVVTFAGATFDTGVTNGAGSNTAFFVNADDAFTIPTGAGGMYEVLAVVEWAIPGANCDARAKIWLGGTVTAGVVSGGTGAIATKDARLLTAGQQASIVLPFTVELAAGDTIRVAVGQNSGGALAVKGDGSTRNTYFEVKYLGPKHA